MLEYIASRDEMGDLLNWLGLRGIGAEIGVFKGHNAASILSQWKGQKLLLIDPYNISKCGKYYDSSIKRHNQTKVRQEAHKRLERFTKVDRCEFWRMTSDEAAEKLRAGGIGLDFAYIDANHHNPQIRRDLDNYWPLVVDGGLFCGHDYCTSRFDVKAEVDLFLKTHEYREFYKSRACSSWWILK